MVATDFNSLLSAFLQIWRRFRIWGWTLGINKLKSLHHLRSDLNKFTTHRKFPSKLLIFVNLFKIKDSVNKKIKPESPIVFNQHSSGALISLQKHSTRIVLTLPITRVQRCVSTLSSVEFWRVSSKLRSSIKIIENGLFGQRMV